MASKYMRLNTSLFHPQPNSAGPEVPEAAVNLQIGRQKRGPKVSETDPNTPGKNYAVSTVIYAVSTLIYAGSFFLRKRSVPPQTRVEIYESFLWHVKPCQTMIGSTNSLPTLTNMTFGLKELPPLLRQSQVLRPLAIGNYFF